MPRDWKGQYSRRLIDSKGGRYWAQKQRAASERGKRMAKARWDKWRAEVEHRPEPEPKYERYFPLEFGVRVKATGETHFHDLVSVRHASKALGLILKYCA